MRDKILIEYYKIARSSVEHFDRLLANFRQILFAFNGVFISTSITFFLSSWKNTDIRYIKFFLISNLLVTINILIWLLEKHYHRYLITSAYVANNIEKELFAEDKEKHLTYQIGLAKRYRVKKEKFLWFRMIPCVTKWASYELYRPSPFVRSYDLMYLLPIAASLGFNLFLAHRAKASADINWLLYAGYISLLIYLIIGCAIMTHNYYFEKEFKLDK